MDLKNSTVLVTGATSGIGKATAVACHKEGARIVAVARRKERLDALAKELGEKRVHAVACDIADAQAYGAALKSLPADFAAVDVLVNNAGLALGKDPYAQVPWEDIARMVEVNVTGLLQGTRAILPGMLERGRGHVINLGSTAGVWPSPGNAVYGATKAFVRQFSLALRADLLGTPIRVTEIEPGMAETEFSMVRYKGDKTKADAFYAGMTPMEAGDIADAILWAVTRPARVNVNTMQIMPVDQAFAPLAIHRRK